MLLLIKDSHAFLQLQVFDLIVLGRVPFMDFQCTPLIMVSPSGYCQARTVTPITVAHELHKFASVVILAKM